MGDRTQDSAPSERTVRRRCSQDFTAIGEQTPVHNSAEEVGLRAEKLK
jgi:hypothetical protein